MPFLIKSSNGKRAIQAPGLSVGKEPNLKDEIVAALKGLTFKIEIKIADIVVTQPEESKEKEPVAQRPSANYDLKNDVAPMSLPTVPKPERVEFLRPALVPQPDPIKRVPNQPDEVQNQSASFDQRPTEARHLDSSATTNTRASDISLKPQNVPELNGSGRENADTGTKVTDLQPIIKMTTHDALAQTMVHKKPAVLKASESSPPLPEPSPPNASLKIGSNLETCCIAVDERSNPPAAYIASDDKALMSLFNSISEAGADIERLPERTSFKIGETVLAKSTEDNSWYRARIVSIEGNGDLEIFFFDWGLTEVIPPQRIRDMMPEFSKFPIFALKIEFLDTPKEILDEALKCENLYKMYVDSYNEVSGCYRVKVSGQVR